MSLTEPEKINDSNYRFDAFDNNDVLSNKKKNHLPAMGWNSWNAFGSGNTELLTKAMADSIVNLGLDKLGYKFVILDDGCYKSERINGKLENDEVKFPGGFKKLSDYIHSKGLKFGMYNDIGTNLCAGAAVGTCGHEKTDGKSYIDWGVDFLKIDNCYFLWDNATFSNPENAKYVYAPRIKSIKIFNNSINSSDSTDSENNFNHNESSEFKITLEAKEGTLTGNGGILRNLNNDEKKAAVNTNGEEFSIFSENIGTFDGTNTGTTPLGPRSSELRFEIDIPKTGEYFIQLNYATSKEPGTGCWLQIATGTEKESKIFYDDLLPETPTKNDFLDSPQIKIQLKKRKNILRIMNHRRQENTLVAYAAMLDGLNSANPEHDVILSICEWGKTQPQNWGYKVGDSWRILNDITFQVGSDGDAGFGEWENPGTQSITSQYNKAVIMDEFAGLDKGWNDPDMLMIGMKGLTPVMNKTHFTMWCMMNSPLMLGLDLRRVKKDDEIFNIITNKELINLNQDGLGIQAKRIWTSNIDNTKIDASKEYITDNERSDILAKPLEDGSIAISYINLSKKNKSPKIELKIEIICKKLNKKVPSEFMNSITYEVKDLWTKNTWQITNSLQFESLEPCNNQTLRITPKK